LGRDFLTIFFGLPQTFVLPDFTQVYLKPFTDLVDPIFEHFGTMGEAVAPVAPKETKNIKVKKIIRTLRVISEFYIQK
jgi:hypothetical protein